MQNDTMEPPSKSKVEVKSSEISGNGTFAKEKIAHGEYIATLSGKPIVTQNISAIGPEFGVTVDDPLQIGDNLFLILNYESKTINHSCSPNAGIRNQCDLYALKDIKIGDEITYDYSTTSGVNDTWSMPCGCKTLRCRHSIGNILTIPFMQLDYYIKQNAIPDFIKIQLQKLGFIKQKPLQNELQGF